MATRNLTSKFESLRAQLRGGKRRVDDGSGGLLSGARSDDFDSESSTGIPTSLPPEWVDIVDSIHKDTNSVKDSIRTLQRLHAARLKVSFGDNVIAEQERDIEILTQEITRLLRRSEQSVKKIAVVGNTGKLSPQEKVRFNTQLYSLCSFLTYTLNLFVL